MNIMEISEEDKKRLEEKLRRLDRTPDKPCRWIKNRIEYRTYFTMGLIIGLMEGLRMK